MISIYIYIYIFTSIMFNLHKRNWFCLHFYFDEQFSCEMTGVDGITCVRLFPCTCVLHRLSVRGSHTTDTIFLLHGVEGRGRLCRFMSCRLSVRAAFRLNSIVCVRFRRPPGHLCSGGLNVYRALKGTDPFF